MFNYFALACKQVPGFNMMPGGALIISNELLLNLVFAAEEMVLRGNYSDL